MHLESQPSQSVAENHVTSGHLATPRQLQRSARDRRRHFLYDALSPQRSFGTMRRGVPRAKTALRVAPVATNYRSRLQMLAAAIAILMHDSVAQQLSCTNQYFVDAASRINADCCTSATTGAGHRRTQGTGTCNGVPSECGDTLCAETFTEFFATCESQLRVLSGFIQYQELNSECIATMQHPHNSLSAVPEPEPEPEAFGEGCPPAFLGPDLGYMNVMMRGPDGRCSLSLRSLSVVCSGAMFQTCIDFLHSSDMGPGDRHDPDYRAKHPEPEPWGGGR